jgi:hypothetical protein
MHFSANCVRWNVKISSGAACLERELQGEPHIPRLRPKRAPLGMTIQERMPAPLILRDYGLANTTGCLQDSNPDGL